VEDRMEHDDDIGRDPHRDRPRKANRRAVEVRLDAVAQALDIAFVALTEVRRELCVGGVEIERTTLPMRCAEPWERDP